MKLPQTDCEFSASWFPFTNVFFRKEGHLLLLFSRLSNKAAEDCQEVQAELPVIHRSKGTMGWEAAAGVG